MAWRGSSRAGTCGSAGEPGAVIANCSGCRAAWSCSTSAGWMTVTGRRPGRGCCAAWIRLDAMRRWRLRSERPESSAASWIGIQPAVCWCWFTARGMFRLQNRNAAGAMATRLRRWRDCRGVGCGRGARAAGRAVCSRAAQAGRAVWMCCADGSPPGWAGDRRGRARQGREAARPGDPPEAARERAASCPTGGRAGGDEETRRRQAPQPNHQLVTGKRRRAVRRRSGRKDRDSLGVGCVRSGGRVTGGVRCRNPGRGPDGCRHPGVMAAARRRHHLGDRGRYSVQPLNVSPTVAGCPVQVLNVSPSPVRRDRGQHPSIMGR